jgi:hypothetical protein
MTDEDANTELGNGKNKGKEKSKQTHPSNGKAL